MDLQARKLNLIEYLINLKDEKLFDKIEAIAKDNKLKTELYVDDPFTQEEMIARAVKANEDYIEGRVLTTEELEAEIKNW